MAVRGQAQSERDWVVPNLNATTRGHVTWVHTSKPRYMGPHQRNKHLSPVRANISFGGAGRTHTRQFSLDANCSLMGQMHEVQEGERCSSLDGAGRHPRDERRRCAIDEIDLSSAVQPSLALILGCQRATCSKEASHIGIQSSQRHLASRLASRRLTLSSK